MVQADSHMMSGIQIFLSGDGLVVRLLLLACEPVPLYAPRLMSALAEHMRTRSEAGLPHELFVAMVASCFHKREMHHAGQGMWASNPFFYILAHGQCIMPGICSQYRTVSALVWHRAFQTFVSR